MTTTRGTVPPSDARIRGLEASNHALRQELRSDHRRVRRAFLYGAVIFGALGAIAGAALGETISIGATHNRGQPVLPTTISIEPSSEPGQLAVVTLVNHQVNNLRDNGEYFIAIPGLAVGVRFTWDADAFMGADRILVTPPEGIVCIPADCQATVPEGQIGRVVLLGWVGG
jgi:hypothetical protein